MGDMRIEDYEKLSAGVNWLNLPKSLILALFHIADVLTEIRDELRRIRVD